MAGLGQTNWVRQIVFSFLCGIALVSCSGGGGGTLNVYVSIFLANDPCDPFTSSDQLFFSVRGRGIETDSAQLLPDDFTDPVVLADVPLGYDRTISLTGLEDADPSFDFHPWRVSYGAVGPLDILAGSQLNPGFLFRCVTFLPTAPYVRSNGVTGFSKNFSVAGASSGGQSVEGFALADIVVGNPGVTPSAVLFFGDSSQNPPTPFATSATLPLPPGGADATFGTSVDGGCDFNGDNLSDLVVGEPGTSSVHLYIVVDQVPVLVTPPSPLQLPTVEANAEFGATIKFIGDFNGDRYCDLLVSAPRADVNLDSDAGRSFIFLGSAGGFSADSIIELTLGATDRTANEQFGAIVAAGGDLNGDGFDDLTIGRPFKSVNGQAFAGEIVIYFGRPATGGEILPSATLYAPSGEKANENFGSVMTINGDVNGDGRSDLVVGFPDDINEVTTDVKTGGRVLVYLGRIASINASPDLQLLAEDFFVDFAIVNPEQVRFGQAVSISGDRNGDGLSDLLIGFADGDPDNNGSTSGRAELLYATGQVGLFDPADGTAFATPDAAWTDFGESIQLSPDVTGDSFADIVVGVDDVDQGFVVY